MIILTIIFFVFLALILLLFRKKLIFLVWFLIIVLVASFVFRIIKGYFPVPVNARHVIHLLFQPKDLLAPIVIDDFLFHEKGFSRTYVLKPKYLDFYECGFLSEDTIPSDFKFNGKIKFEFYWKDKKLFEEVITQWKTFGKNYVSLIDFEVPLMGRHKKDISVKVTVLKPDLELQNKNPKLYVAVSGIP